MWELDYKESWVLKNWCFWNVVLEKTLESPLDCKEIQPVTPKGDQHWIFIGSTDAVAGTRILWPLMQKTDSLENPDAGNDWRQEKGTTEDEMIGWHHWLNEHEFEQAPGVGDGQESPAGLEVVKSWTWLSDWTELRDIYYLCLMGGDNVSQKGLRNSFKVMQPELNRSKIWTWNCQRSFLFFSSHIT